MSCPPKRGQRLNSFSRATMGMLSHLLGISFDSFHFRIYLITYINNQISTKNMGWRLDLPFGTRQYFKRVNLLNTMIKLGSAGCNHCLTSPPMIYIQIVSMMGIYNTGLKYFNNRFNFFYYFNKWDTIHFIIRKTTIRITRQT